MISSIENYYEHMVIDRIHRVLAENQEDEDPVRIADLTCLALNQLPPRYIRHFVDIALHIGDEERLRMDDNVKDAVEFAFQTYRRRQDERSDEANR